MLPHTPPKSQSHHIHPVSDDGQIRCYKHNVVAPKRTATTEKNVGREFYCCYKHSGDSDRCSFFFWADDPTLARRPPSSQPQSSLSHAMATPPVTPEKAPSSQKDPAASQRRLALIQAALAETELNADADTPTRKRPRSPPTPMTPTQRRRLAPAAPISSFPKREDEEPVLSSSDDDERRFWQPSSTRSSPATDHTYEHGRDGSPAHSSYHTALSLPSPPPSSSRDPPSAGHRALETPTRAQSAPNADASEEEDDMSERPTALLRDLARLPAYVTKLERKAAAAAQSVKARDARILELEKKEESKESRIQTLEARVRYLEATNAALAVRKSGH